MKELSVLLPYPTAQKLIGFIKSNGVGKLVGVSQDGDYLYVQIVATCDEEKILNEVLDYEG